MRGGSIVGPADMTGRLKLLKLAPIGVDFGDSSSDSDSLEEVG